MLLDRKTVLQSKNRPCRIIHAKGTPRMPCPLPQTANRNTLPRVRNSDKGAVLPRRRNEIKPADAVELPERFALHLREIMERRGLSSKGVAELLAKAGLDVGHRGVDVWLRGEGLPKAKDLERIGV